MTKWTRKDCHALSVGRSLKVVDLKIVTHAVIGQALSDILLPYTAFPPTAYSQLIYISSVITHH